MGDVVIAKLSALLGFKLDDKNLLKFKLGMLTAIGTVAKFSADIVRATVDLDNFSKRTGISAEIIRDWEILAEQTNVSTASIQGAFESIASMKGKLLAGQGLDSAWGILGINGSENPEVIFNKVLNQLGKIQDVNLRNARLSSIGFDPQLVNLIGKTREDVDGIFKDLRLTEQERKSLIEVKKSFTEFKILLSNLKEKFVALFYPIKLFIDLGTRLYTILYKIIDNTIGWNNAIKILASLFMGLMVVFAPMLSMITAIGLAIEDVWTYFEGGESYFGSFIEQAGVLGQVIAGLVKGFALFIKTGLEGLPIVFNIAKAVFGGFLDLLKSIYDTLMMILEPLGKVVGYIGKGIGKGFKVVKSLFKDEEEDNIKPDIKTNIKPNIKPTIDTNSIIPNNSYHNNNTNNKNIINNINMNNNIDGVRNPEAISQDIYNSLSQQLSETETQL